MKKVIALVLAASLMPATTYAAFTHTKTVTAGRSVKVCVPAGEILALVGTSGPIAREAVPYRPGKCRTLKTPKDAAPGAYRLVSYRTGANEFVDPTYIGTVTVKAQKAKR